MDLRGRIKRLELKKVTCTASDARQRLTERLAMIEARLVAGGDYEHKEGASLAENLVRARLRGETAAS